ncbi:MAG: MurR/RpiR family transcriptional regulator, partial [Eubacteriales bacterium]
MTQESIFDKITMEYYQLTGSERKVADFILKNGEKTQFMSITELAEVTVVAEATITRFCKRLGFKGYNALKLSVASATAAKPHESDLPPKGQVAELCQKLCAINVEAITHTANLVDPDVITETVSLLHRADTVLCLGQGGSMTVAQQASHLFSTVFPQFSAVWDSHAQIISIAHLKSNDIALIFSYSGSTSELSAMLEQVRKRGAKSILITRFPKSYGGLHADLVLQCSSNETPLQIGSVPAAMAQLFLVDILYHELCLMDVNHANKTR